MESLTRLVTESLARHGFDRPLDYRRLRWSRWFRCESHHSLLLVPSKPGVFAIAEEIADFGTAHGGADALVRPAERSSAVVEERRFSAASSEQWESAASAADGSIQTAPRRMLAVTQFFEADDMAFVLDRMLARPNPMRDSLNSGRYFIRYVVIEDASQRRSVGTALNQWLADQSVISQSTTSQSFAGSAEQAGNIALHFASSLELTPATEYVPASAQASLFDHTISRSGGPANRTGEVNKASSIAAQQLDSGAETNIHCPSSFPSGF